MSVDSGLLLSHKNYPWEYEPSKIMTPREPNKTCHKKLWLEADTKIVVSVHTIDVAEGDSLLIITDSTIKNIRDKTTLVYYDYQTKSVEFNFTVTQESNGGKGFIVCFKSKSVLLYTILTWPRGYKTFFVLNSTEYEIFPAHKC